MSIILIITFSSLLISQLQSLFIFNRRKSSSTTSSDGSPRATPTTRIKKIRKSSNSSSRNSVRSVATVDSEEPLNSEMKNENNIENMHSILVKSLISNLQLDNKNKSNDHNHGSENENKKERNDTSENGSTNYYGDSDDNEASNFNRVRTESDTVQSISPPFSPHSVASTVVSTTQDQHVQKTPSTASTPCRTGILEDSSDVEIPSSSVEKSRSVISSNNNNVETKNKDNEDKSVEELKMKLNELNIGTDSVCGVSNDALALQSVMAALDSALNSPAKPEENEINNETGGEDSIGVIKHRNENNHGHETKNENENENRNEGKNAPDEVKKGTKKVESEGSMITHTATLNGYSTTLTAPVDDHTHRTSAIDRDYVNVEKEVAGNSNMSDITSRERPGSVSGVTLDEDEEEEEVEEEEDEEEYEEDEDEEDEDGDDENDEDDEEDAVDPGPQIPNTTESTYEGSDVSEENADIENIEVGPKSGIKGLQS